MLGRFLSEEDKKNQGYSNTLSNIQVSLTNLTNTIGVLQQDKGKFPAQPQPNPQGIHYTEEFPIIPLSYEEAKDVTVLRSGKEIDKTIHPKNPPPLDNSANLAS